MLFLYSNMYKIIVPYRFQFQDYIESIMSYVDDITIIIISHFNLNLN